MNKSITFLIAQMLGGGAERVISLLCNSFSDLGYNVTLIISNQTLGEADLESIHKNVNMISLADEVKNDSVNLKKALMLKARITHKICKLLSKDSDNKYLIQKYRIRNYDKINWLTDFFNKYSIDTAIAFLNEPIFLSLLSKNKHLRLIISERNDPQKFESTKTTIAFIRKMYPKSDAMVFQSPDAMQWYHDNTNVKGRVISNPIKPDLPERYTGERKKKIVNFCRISSQKNLHLLVNAFELFSKDYPDYELYIYGNAVGNGAEGYIDSVNKNISHLSCQDRIHFFPAQKDIHNLINDYAMFVSSSDFEGMSNSMLEAMAIGLPTICTDCPAGGARAIIKDHENGILVPVNDIQAMAEAMKEVADNPNLAEKLSINGTKIRYNLSVDKIVNQWMEIING